MSKETWINKRKKRRGYKQNRGGERLAMNGTKLIIHDVIVSGRLFITFYGLVYYTYIQSFDIWLMSLLH